MWAAIGERVSVVGQGPRHSRSLRRTATPSWIARQPLPQRFRCWTVRETTRTELDRRHRSDVAGVVDLHQCEPGYPAPTARFTADM
jgi:hypothetical protein